MKKIVVANQKGGVGKSTTSWALAHALSRAGYKVLAVDMDDQCNFSLISGASFENETIYELLNSGDLGNSIQKLEHYDMIAGSRFLPALELKLNSAVGREYRLSECLEEVQDYDFCIIDTSPSLSTLTINALVASDEIIVPVQADILCLSALSALEDTLSSINKRIKPVSIAGLLLTRHNSRTRLSKDLMEALEERAQELHTKIFDQSIRESVVLREAQLNQVSPYEYSFKAPAVQDYFLFSQEFLGDTHYEKE